MSELKDLAPGASDISEILDGVRRLGYQVKPIPTGWKVEGQAPMTEAELREWFERCFRHWRGCSI